MSLSSELKPKRPVGQFLRRTFPFLQPVQADYREATAELTPIVVGVKPTVGTAFDWRLRAALTRTVDVTLPYAGAQRSGDADLADLAAELIADLNGMLVFGGPTPAVDPSGGRPDPIPLPDAAAEDRLLRSCVVLAWFTELFRAGPPRSEGHPLVDPRARASVDSLLATVPADDVRDLGALAVLAGDRLLPAVASWAPPLYLGPTFAGSVAIGGADADLIAGDVLVDVKALIGRQTRAGGRRAQLRADTVYQILGYALLDDTDRYGVRRVAFYQARYGHLASWTLADLLDTLAGRPVDLAAARAGMREAIAAGNALDRARAEANPSWATALDPAIAARVRERLGLGPAD